MLSKLKITAAFVGTFAIGLAIGAEVYRNHQMIVKAEAKSHALLVDLARRYSNEDANTVFTMILPSRSSNFFIDHQVQSFAHGNQFASPSANKSKRFSAPNIYTH